MPHAGMAPGQDLQMPPAMMMFQGSQVAGGPMDRGHHGPNADRQGWPMMSMPFNASPQSGMMPVQGNVMGVSSLGGHGEGFLFPVLPNWRMLFLALFWHA